MSDRAKELFQDFLRYLREAFAEWRESLEDSPPSHAYTLLIGALVCKVIGWFL